jgi:peroxiredoxin
MKAWSSTLDPSQNSKIRFLADPSAAFTKKVDMAFENQPIFGGTRSKRYALEVEDGVVKGVHVEPDNTGVKGMFVDVIAAYVDSSILREQALLTGVSISLQRRECSWIKERV